MYYLNDKIENNFRSFTYFKYALLESVGEQVAVLKNMTACFFFENYVVICSQAEGKQ
jgi:hypothetical protein